MTSPSGTNDKPSAGDPLPPRCSVIEVHVSELKQLFNSIDPSPFRNKDLDPKAEEFIVGWAKDLPVRQLWSWSLISTARLGYRMRLLFFATRFTSSLVNALRHIDGVCANCSDWAGPAL
jgi:hypothetical protein